MAFHLAEIFIHKFTGRSVMSARRMKKHNMFLVWSLEKVLVISNDEFKLREFNLVNKTNASGTMNYVNSRYPNRGFHFMNFELNMKDKKKYTSKFS